MQTALNKIANSLWLLLIVTIILGGVLVSAGRLASPYLSNFKPKIEAELSRLAGTPVQIGDLQARWQGFGPALLLRDIAFGQRGEEAVAMRLQRVDLDLSLKSFFHSGRLLPWNITLHGIELQLTRNADDRFEVSGLQPADSSTAGEADLALEPLLQMPRIELKNTTIQWQDLTGKTPNADFGEVNLLLRNDGQRHQADLSFNLPGDKLQSVQLAADLRFPDTDLQRFDGDLYLMTRNFNITAWLRELVPPPFQVEQGNTDSDLWLSFADGKLTRIEGQTLWRELRVTTLERPDALNIQQASAMFRLEHQPDSWQLDIDDFRLSAERIEWPSTQLHYRRDAQTGTFLAISHIETRLWQSLAATLLPIDLSVPSLELDGQLKNLYARWDKDFTQWYSQGDLQGLSVISATLDETDPAAQQPPNLPGVRNLTASFTASHAGGLLQIDSQDTQYLHPGLFRNPIELVSLAGSLQWLALDDGGWQIETEYLEAVSPHISTASRAKIRLPAEGKPYLDLQTDFRDGDATHAGLYYPVGIMGTPLVEWLDRSIISGRVTSGSMVLKGPAEDFAFSTTHNGHFEVLFNVEDTVLDYFPEWPRLEEVEAEVRFINNSLEINLASAKTLDSEVLEASARIDTLHPISPIRIQGTTTGPASDNLRLLTESPLRKDFARLAEALRITGETKVNLDFQIPLGKRGDYALDGQVNLQDNVLQLQDWDLQLDNINGKLQFDLDGLSANDIRARLLNAPIEVDIQHDAASRTRFTTSAKLSLRQLQSLVGAIPTEAIAGSTVWDVDLLIPPLSASQKTPAELVIRSNLKGVAVNAPAPLLKTATELRRLEVTTLLQPGSKLPLTIRYDDKLQAALMLDVSQPDQLSLQAGQILFGDGKPTTPNNRLLSVKGRLDTLQLDQWLGLTSMLADTPGERLPVALDLAADQLSFRDYGLSDFSLRAKIDSGSLSGTVSSEELAGRFTIPDYSRLDRLKIALERAELTFNDNAESTDKEEAEDTPAQTVEPSSLPSLELSVEKLKINEKQFGQLTLKTTTGQRNLRIDQFEIDGKRLQATASGLWSTDANQQRTSLDFALESENYGRVLENLGFTTQIAQGTGKIKGSLSWPGGPHQFSETTLSGQLALNLEEGRFRDLEPGVGRVLGILNLAALQRRLALDFSDLFKEGFTFDEIAADFTLDRGDAYTNNLLIKSPSSTINLSGRTGLAQQDFDQLVTVTPSLQSTITLAGAVTAGPAGAAVAYLAQKLIGNEVDKIARTRYSISGSWEDPQITKLSKSEDQAETE